MNKGRLFLKIIEHLQKDAFPRFKKWHSKSAWREMTHNNDKVNLINVKTAVDVIRDHVELFCKEKIKKNRTGGKKFCLLRKVIEKRSKPEDRIERLLVASVDNLYNRFNFLSGLTPEQFNNQTKHMTIDLVEARKENEVDAFIELKASDSEENPLSALCEVIMYFLLFKEVRERIGELPTKLSKRFRLIVLAPKQYFECFGRNQDRWLHKYIASSIREHLGTKCEFAEINLTKEHFINASACLKKTANAYQKMEIIS